MIRIELSRTFPVPVGDAFAFITDTRNWKVFFPNFVRLHDPERAKWDAPGDKATVAIRILGRIVDVNMTLDEIRKDERVTYVSRQRGLPEARHERHFKAVPGGFEFRLIVAFDSRSGLAGLYDRCAVKPAVAAALRKTIENLDSVFAQRNLRT